VTVSATDLCYLTIDEARDLLRRRRLSPVELTHAFLNRIEAVDHKTHAFVTVTAEAALEQARVAEAEIAHGKYRGPLHGIPIALKDLYNTRGVRTTAHSRVLADNVPLEDATAVARLRRAGAVILGKLAMHEFALGGQPDPRALFPPARNPWDLSRIPGGSSSGSGVAVAAGLCMGALGSDTGGSIRRPASHCGIVGLKPTYGRVSRYGVYPLAWSLDHCGPMTRTVEDTALMLQAIAGADPQDPTASAAPVPDYRAALRAGIQGLRIGVPRHYYFTNEPDVDPQVLAAVDQALDTLRGLGCEVRDVEVPSLADASPAGSIIMTSEAYAYHEKDLRERPDDYGPTRRQFLIGGLLTAADYIQAQRVRGILREEFAAVLRDVDVLVTPSFPMTAPPFEGVDPAASSRGFRYLTPFNLTGLPALSVPCGFTAAGLPIGMQVVARPFAEETVLRLGYAYQQATPWTSRHPDL
jgi:aspartyl-tRNA(Asn)/glutamyl-tRNA(Gln) amidotransferase subunit A